MNTSTIIFYAIAALILGAAILAVTTLKIFRSAIWLLFSLVGIAALYFWMQVEFIACRICGWNCSLNHLFYLLNPTIG